MLKYPDLLLLALLLQYGNKKEEEMNEEMKKGTAIQQIVVENYFNQAQLSAVLIGIGALIMEIKKLSDKE